MRVRDVTSNPVVTVPPDMRLKTDASVHLPNVAAEAMTRTVVALPEDADAAEAGRLMLERRIKSISIVQGRWVVGIVARRDLLKVPARRDEDIARDLEALLTAEPGAAGRYRTTVRDGIVKLTGLTDPTSRRLARCSPVACPGSSRSGSTRSDGHDHLSGASGGRRGAAGRLDGARAAGQAR